MVADPPMPAKLEFMIRRLIWMKAPKVPSLTIEQFNPLMSSLNMLGYTIIKDSLGICDDRSHGWVPETSELQPGHWSVSGTWIPCWCCPGFQIGK